MKIYQYCFILFFSFNIVQAQNYKFGKVSKEELEEKFNPNDITANATVLYKKEEIKFEFKKERGFVQVRKVHERIKIYNKKGFDWATKKVILYNRSATKSESLKSLKGNTFALINGKIEKTKLKNEGVFNEVVNKYWKIKSFTMPNIKEGGIIEFYYEIESPYFVIHDIEFQYSIPIKKLDCNIRIPEYFHYNKLLNPKALFYPKIIESKTRKTIVINGFEHERTKRFVKGKTTYSSSEIEFEVNKIEANLINIPALIDEPLVDNVDNYKAKLILELSSVEIPQQPLELYSTSWEKVTKSIYDDIDFGFQLDASNYYENDLQSILNGESDPRKQIFLIYNYVKSKVKWNGLVGYGTDEGTKNAYKKGSGNVADINLMLISMLRKVDISANPVLVSTKNNGIPLFPTRQGFNYVMCLVEIEDSSILLDATERFCTFNILPIRTLNWQGRVIRKNGNSNWISLNPSELSKETITLNAKILPEFDIEGVLRSQITGYIAMEYRTQFSNIDADTHIKYLEKDKGELIIEDLKFENSNKPLLPINLTYNYQLTNSVEEIGNKLYFSPLLFLALQENPYKQKNRQYSLNFNYPVSKKYMVNIMLPEGYVVESLPKSEGFNFNNESGKFSYLIKDNGKFLQMVMKLTINTPLVLAEDYEVYKDFYKLIIEKQTEKVVLKKE